MKTDWKAKHTVADRIANYQIHTQTSCSNTAFIYATRTCFRCHQSRPVKGGTRKGKKFICQTCKEHTQ